MNNVIFLDGAEQQWIVHWLGIPYLLESSFGGRFHNVLTMDEQSIDLSLERKILDKFFLMKRSGIEPNGWGCDQCALIENEQLKQHTKQLFFLAGQFFISFFC